MGGYCEDTFMMICLGLNICGMQTGCLSDLRTNVPNAENWLK